MNRPSIVVLLPLAVIALVAVIARGGNAPVPVYWSQNGASVGLTIVALVTAGHTVTASDGSDFTPLTDISANQVRVENMNSVAVEVQRGASGDPLPVAANGNWTFRGITNASQLQVRRVDQSTTPITVNYEAESASP